MRLKPTLVEHWPKLSWCARVTDHELSVLHGRRVETAEDWVFEGTWAGDFGAGDFDQSVSAVSGTGVRLRDGAVSFATSMNILDRLFYIEQTNEVIVSNSLACLLGVSGARLAPEFLHSSALIKYLEYFHPTPLSLPTEGGPNVQVHIYDHLVFANGSLTRQPRVDPAPEFESFEEYRRFLHETMVAIRENFGDARRKYEIAPVATISNGYDSSAAAVVAEPLGIRSALTIARGGVLSLLNDSGDRIADKLDLPIRRFLSRDLGYKDHLLIWAGTGRSLDLNVTLFDFPDDLTLLVVGTHGDVIWQKGLTSEYQRSRHFLDREPSGTGLTEWRLHRGVFLAAIPFLGASKWDCLRRIHESDAMDPYRLGGGYDRPIPRRIVEERGVERNAFGRKKTQTASRSIYHPSDREHMHDLAKFLAGKNKKLPRRLGILQRPVHLLRNQVHSRTGWFPRKSFDDLYFLWANNYLAEHVYQVSSPSVNGGIQNA